MIEVMTGEDPFAHDDAAYVLGALDPEERGAFERHLAGCAACRGRVDAVSGVPDLLAAVEPGDIAALLEAERSEPPDDMFATLRAAATRERARRRRNRVLAAVGGLAAAAALVGGLVVGFGGGDGASGPVAAGHGPVDRGRVVLAAAPLTPVGPTSVAARATLVRHRWGTEIRLRCTHRPAGAGGAPDDDWYALVVRSRAGVSEVAGTWAVPGGGPTTFVSGTWLSPADIAQIDITLPNGKDVLELRR